MSRRNHRQRHEWAEIPGLKTVRVVCTDDGQHPAVSFGKIDAWPAGAGEHPFHVHNGWSVLLALQHSDRAYEDLTPYEPQNDLTPTTERIHRTFRLRCRRCRRDPQLREETIERIGAEFAAAGKDTFDISSLH